MSLFTVSLIVLGAFTLSAVSLWAVLRLGAWCDGREW